MGSPLDPTDAQVEQMNKRRHSALRNISRSQTTGLIWN